MFAFGSDPKNLFAFATLNWASARATFVINGTEMGGQWGNNDNTSLLGNTPGNRPSPLGKWYQVALTMRDVTPEGGDPATTLKYYMDGELLCNLTTPSSISALGDLTYAYIGTGNIKDYKDFEGGIRGVSFIGSVLSQRQIAEKYEKEELFYAKTDEEIVKEAAASLSIPNADDIRGNITLPDIYNGASVAWTSSNEDVVSTAVQDNEGYDSTPAGVVTRGSEDVQVKLTATISKGAVVPVKKDIDLTVKAKSEISEEDYKAYVFAYFTGEGYATGEQIYFATSQDGLHWEGTNEGDPVLSSTMGEQGLRDPFIIRSPEGDRFYLIATDLKINGGNGWTAAQQAGSQSIMVWESTDMVNWTDQRMVKVARDNAGCTWAPEAFYDEKTGEYIVFWASKTSDDNYSVQKVYYAKTRDFYTFTEPEVWIELYKTTDGRPLSIIDTSVISVMENGKKVYYRFSKNEAGEDHDSTEGWGKYTIMERSDSLLGEWSEVKAFKDNRGVEGGTCFKFNGEDKWCLLLDDHGGVGYFPLLSTDLGSGEFTRLDTSEYSFPSKMRHGTVLPLTQKEYDAVMAKYSSEVKENQEEPQQEPILKYDFENTTASGKIEDTTGNGQDGLLCGNATLVEDADRDGKVLRLNGTKGTFASLPTGLFDGRNQVTISMDVKASDVSGNYFTFTVGRNDQKYIFLKTEDTSSRLSMTVESGGKEQTARGNTEAIKDRWANFTMVVTPEKIALYVDGLKIGEKDVTLKMTDLGANVVSYIGKSFYSADKYFNGYFDNVEVFNRAMDAQEIADRNGVELPEEKVTVTYAAGKGGKIEGEAVQTIEKGSATTEVTAVADEGYEFVQWSDGNKEAARSDSNVTEDVRYTAEFMKKEVPEEKVTVTYEAGEGGRIEGEAEQTIEKGSATTEVTAVADEGYEFTQWSDGKKEATRSDSNVTKDVQYTAEFVKKDEPVNPPEEKVTVTYEAGKGGKIQGTAEQTIDKGADTTEVTAVADPGYTFNKWSDGVTSAKRIDRGVTASKKVTALFTENPAPNPDVKPDAASVKLSAKKLTMGVKEKVTLKATVLPAKADQKVTFTSSNKKVASVNAAGKITGKKAGKAKITVKTANGKKSTCVVTVKKAPKKISVKPKKKTLKVGKSLKLKVVLPQKTASYKRTFKSSKPKVAAVSAAGKVTAKKKGTAVITVRTFNGKKATVKITVK